MGSWGEGFLENDNALDIALYWDEYAKPLLASNLASKIWPLFRDLYFRRHFDCLDPQQNAEVLAIAALYNRSEVPLPEGFVDILERAAQAELRPSALSEWPEKKSRKDTITALLLDIGRAPRPLSKAESENGDLSSLIQDIQQFLKETDKWIDVVLKLKDDDEFERTYPDYFHQLERLLTAGLPVPRIDTEQEMLLIKLRFMLTAFHFGWKARLSPDEIRYLMGKAAATNGYFFMANDVFGQGNT